MLTVVVADAPDVDIKLYRSLIEQAELRMAADGGVRYLLALGIMPDILIGDMDSVPESVLAELAERGIQIERYPVEKAETDLELAVLRALEYGASQVVILAALGGRPDHHLANLLLLSHPQLRGKNVQLRDGAWEVRLVDGTLELVGEPGELVSLLPLGEARGISTEGLYYPLHDEPLHLGPARGVSNVLTGHRAQVTVREGLLLLFHYRQGGD